MRNIVSLSEIRSFLRKKETFHKLELEYLRRNTVKVTYYISAEVELISTGPHTILLRYRINTLKRFLVGLFSGFIESKLDQGVVRWDRDKKQIEVLLDRIGQLQKFFLYAEIKDLTIQDKWVVLDLTLL